MCRYCNTGAAYGLYRLIASLGLVQSLAEGRIPRKETTLPDKIALSAVS
jgi:hypothetical protein